jgi:hypothetical protein
MEVVVNMLPFSRYRSLGELSVFRQPSIDEFGELFNSPWNANELEFVRTGVMDTPRESVSGRSSSGDGAEQYLL